MTSRTTLTALLIACSALVFFTVSAKAEMIGISWEGWVYEIDEATGTGAEIGPAFPFRETNSMAMDASATIYSAGLDLYITERPYLITIDPVSGVATYGPWNALHIAALAFSQNGVLFAIRQSDPLGSDLFTIDVDTGQGTLVGSTGLRGIAGLDFSPDGTLYGYDVGDWAGIGVGLVTIDTLTGLATDVNSAAGAAHVVATLAFAPDGTLYGAHDSLFSVDVNTGALTLIGSGGYSDIRGMVWIPEPSTLAGLLTMGIVALLAHLWRGKRKRVA